MEKRMNPYQVVPGVLKPLSAAGAYLADARVEEQLLNLVYFRVSQINGCAYCLDMHSKDLRVQGETEQRIYLLSAWREVDLYSQKERAALAWAEAVTKLPGGAVPQDVYDEAVKQFPGEELVDLTIAVIAINSYNRMNIAFNVPAGDYKPGQHKIQKNVAV